MKTVRWICAVDENRRKNRTIAQVVAAAVEVLCCSLSTPASLLLNYRFHRHYYCDNMATFHSLHIALYGRTLHTHRERHALRFSFHDDEPTSRPSPASPLPQQQIHTSSSPIAMTRTMADGSCKRYIQYAVLHEPLLLVLMMMMPIVCQLGTADQHKQMKHGHCHWQPAAQTDPPPFIAVAIISATNIRQSTVRRAVAARFSVTQTDGQKSRHIQCLRQRTLQTQ